MGYIKPKKRNAHLERRIKGYEKLVSSLGEKGMKGYTKPGSENPHKN